MKKRTIIGLTAGAVLLAILLAAGFGLYYLTPQKATPPVLAFASDRTGTGDIFVQEPGGELVNLTNDPASDWGPAWSPEGMRLAFTSHRSGNSDIWLLDVPAPGQPPTPRNLTRHPAWDYSATWSPSGQTVAFVSERDGDPEIFVQSLESDSALQLTFNEEMDRLPAWSPDGKLIAFAAVRDGNEHIHLIRPDGTDEQVATSPNLRGTAPAWSPDSKRLAFIGWDVDNHAGIYVIGPEIDNLAQLYHTQSWLGGLHWSADGGWLTFTAWQDGSHEVYALSASGGQPIRLTTDPAWDDSLAINPAGNFAPLTPDTENVARAAASHQQPMDGGLYTGVNLADLGKAYLINDIGFGWGKGFVNWATVEPEKAGNFRWIDPDNVVTALGDQQVKILLRVHGTPGWARPAESSFTQPPDDVTDFANFMTALAVRYKGKVAAYEIWNEPNLTYEWGNGEPEPARYTEMLKAAYSAVKAVDPNALIITGGLATTGDGSATAAGDLTFLQAMYTAGAQGYFDAVGSHPYTFGHAPDEVDPWGLSLSRVQEQHQVMLENGDGDTPIWITEMGWIIKNSWEMGEHETATVSEEAQARYLSGAYAKIYSDWPFVQAAFLFNLDFSTVPWYPAAEPMRWYSIMNPDRTPRPAYTALKDQMHNR